MENKRQAQNRWKPDSTSQPRVTRPRRERQFASSSTAVPKDGKRRSSPDVRESVLQSISSVCSVCLGGKKKAGPNTQGTVAWGSGGGS